MQLPWGLNTSVTYFYGSGNRFADSIATTPYGKPGTNRLNLTATGGASPAIIIPAAVLDRWDGPAVINSGDVIPRNALEGLPLHKVDLHLTKDIRLGGSASVQLVAEVFNLFNHGELRQLQHVAQRDRAGDDGAVRHAEPEHRHGLRPAPGSAGLQNPVLGATRKETGGASQEERREKDLSALSAVLSRFFLYSLV